MIPNTNALDTSTTYFEYDFEKEMKKVIPHHLIDGPCSKCIVRSMCKNNFCTALINFFYSSSLVTRQQILNYLSETQQLDEYYLPYQL